MYEYVDDNQRQEIMRSREEKASLSFGEGGEGYIGPEDWCYNCGDVGHLGDVRCQRRLRDYLPWSLTFLFLFLLLLPLFYSRRDDFL